MRGKPRKGHAAAAFAVALLWTLGAADAGLAQGLCLTAGDDELPPPQPTQPLRFGTTPEVAGTVGLSQGQSKPADEAKTVAALHALQPPRRTLVLRLNRMFMADGRDAIDRFARMADEYAAEGFASEIQVRYHPSPEQEGDMEAWEAFVREAIAEFSSRPAIVGVSVTNEVNLPISPNTSDGAFDGAHEAIVRGVVAARDEADRHGRQDLDVGFTFAWRWLPHEDIAFWRQIGEHATPEFRSALSYVGLQVYPGLVWPPVPLPGRSAGQEVVEALHLLRECHMPIAGVGRETDLWVSENGYSTGPLRRTPTQQAEDLTSTIEEVHAVSGTLGVTDYRWFNLRDNQSDGLDLFSAVGLLYDDYTPKPAFAELRSLTERFGVDEPPALEARCAPERATAASGRVWRIRIGATRESVHELLGVPTRGDERADRWCVEAGGSLRVAYDRRGRVELVVTTGRRHWLRGAGRRVARPGGSGRVGRRAAPRAVTGGIRRVSPRSRALVATRGSRVRFVGAADVSLLDRPAGLRQALARVGLRP